MSHMLTQDDLKSIGELLEEKVPELVKPLIKAEVEPLIKAGVDEIVSGVGEVIDETVLPLLADIDKRLTKVEAEMVTKEYLDEKLGGYVKRPGLAF